MKATKKVRVKLDFVLELTQPTTSVPVAFADFRICDFIEGGLKAINARCADAIDPGARFSIGLDYRKKVPV